MQLNYTLDNIQLIAKQLIPLFDSKIVLLYGEMGSGKTTLTKSLLNELGCKDEITSPTFSLVNEYKIDDGLAYHFDMYRINHFEEILDIGFEDYLASNAWIFIEWPEKIDVLLPNLTVKLYVKIVNNRSRALDLELVNNKN
ncbi:MAG: tRNA (adenosine(37)-N6)-threonylcarbamoyltransferase complex ATPase subunit type 1 TsaE [bacterium]